MEFTMGIYRSLLYLCQPPERNKNLVHVQAFPSSLLDLECPHFTGFLVFVLTIVTYYMVKGIPHFAQRFQELLQETTNCW